MQAYGVFCQFYFDIVEKQNFIISPLPGPLLKGEGELGTLRQSLEEFVRLKVESINHNLLPLLLDFIY